MTKRILLIMFISIMSIMSAKSQDLVYEGITPAPGSEISTFDFTLKFDLTKVIDANGPGEYVIGWDGLYNAKLPQLTRAVTIYKGAQEDDIVVGRTLTTKVTGSDVAFSTSTSDVRFSLDGVLPEAGVTYTMVITNVFWVYPQGGTAYLANSNFNCNKEPLVYTFVGREASAEEIVVTECSVGNDETLKTLSEISYTFNQGVNITKDLFAEVMDNGKSVAKAVGTTLSDDGMTVTYKFDDIPLYSNHSYVITLPKGAVSSKGNVNVVNNEFKVSVKGADKLMFPFKSSIPAANEPTIFNSIEGIFELPEGLGMNNTTGSDSKRNLSLYKNEISDDNFIGKLTGVSNENRDGLIWTNTYALDPEATYIAYIPAGEFRAYDITTGEISEWYNGEVKFELLTPTIAEAGLSPLVFGDPVIGTHGKDEETLTSETAVSYLDKIEIALADKKYPYGGRDYNLWSISASVPVYLYDITDGAENLVNEYSASVKSTDTTPSYNVISASINGNFFTDHKYRLVVPADKVTITNTVLNNYVRNSELAYEFYGDAPTDVELISSSLEENAELSEISSVKWTFKGEFEQNPNLYVRLYCNTTNDIISGTFVASTPIIQVTQSQNITTLIAAFYGADGGPYRLSTKNEYWITIPEGFLYYAGDPSIKNEEITINIKPIEKKPETIEPEFVNLTVEINGVVAALQQAVKGKTVTLKLTPDSNWKVGSLLRNGSSVTDYLEDGSYTTPELTANTWLEAEIEYDGEWAVEQTSGVWEIEGTSIRIYAEGGKIVVEGVSEDNNIDVYGVSGIRINSTKVTEGNDKVIITVAPGQTYIVSVNGVSAKIQL